MARRTKRIQIGIPVQRDERQACDAAAQRERLTLAAWGRRVLLQAAGVWSPPAPLDAPRADAAADVPGSP